MPDPTIDSPATDDPGAPALVTVAQKIAKGKDFERFVATQLSPEKRAEIERLLCSGTGIVRTAHQLNASPSTVMRVRDELMESDPEQFKRLLSGTLRRVAGKAINRIEQGLDEMTEVKSSSIPGISVSLGIIVDKLQVLSGDSPISVVEHRHKIDADSLSRLLESQQRSQRNDEIVVEAVDVTEVKPTT